MNRRLVLYVLCTYVAFFIAIGLIGLVLIAFEAPAAAEVLKTAAAWTPTIVLMALFRRVVPGNSRRRFIRSAFSARIKPRVAVAASACMLVVFALAWAASAVVYDVGIADLLVGVPAALVLVPLHLVGGAVGEELGWRAYLHNELRNRRSVCAASMITGLIWGCWHLPLWLVSGLTGGELVLYVASFLVAIICCSLLIGVFYEQNRNLAIPMFIHFLNNYLLALFAVEASQVLPLFAAAYLPVTVVLLIVTRDSMREKGVRQEPSSAGRQGGRPG